MYWPIGTPRALAARNNQAQTPAVTVSRDGLPAIQHGLTPEAAAAPPGEDVHPAPPKADDPEPPTPITPVTPGTPAIRHVDQEEDGGQEGSPSAVSDPVTGSREPILALKVSRSGHIFVTITSTSITIWQTRPTVILAIVSRSASSLETYGENIGLLLRPDTAIFVVQTRLGYLITYSMATDAESRVYKAHFPGYNNVQRRRQNHAGGPGGFAPDQFFWGPGEGLGVRDVSVRFRMVIKLDAGIESALALDEELVVATQKPAAVQCIRWAPDATGKQTLTELVSRMSWLEKKVTITQMTHDRPMSLSTWITSDGRVYAVQRLHHGPDSGEAGDVDPKKLFRGYCFHIPSAQGKHALRAVINARFSLIAVGCADGAIQVYAAKDYAGNIPPSHLHSLPVTSSVSGTLRTLQYSPDGYCLFAGYDNGWVNWSVYGKSGSHSFNADRSLAVTTADEWLLGVDDAAWIGGAAEILLSSRRHDSVWAIEMARSAVAGCYTSSNLFRTVLQTSTGVAIYRGYDLPDLTTISTEPFLWHNTRIPATYLVNQWPIRTTVISPDGRYIAVAGRRGLAHYSVNSGRWKTFANDEMENEFQIRGGMCWYQHILVASVEVSRTYELRLFSRETALDNTLVLHTQQLPAPVVLVTSSGDDSLLVYTYENLLYHFVFVPASGAVRLVQVGQIAFHGIVRSPARVRGLSWILPESQLADGDPSQDVAVASVLFLVDGKLVVLQPSLNDSGQHKYDMRVIAQNVEFHANMRDEPFSTGRRELPSQLPSAEDSKLRDSLWVYDGNGMKIWTAVQDVLQAVSGEAARDLPSAVYTPLDFYPLSILLGKSVVLGVESELVQRRDVNFSFFRSSIRTHLVLPDILRFYLTRNASKDALQLAEQCQELEYFPHALEILLHQVLDDEVDSSPSPEAAVLPRVLSLLSSFQEYLDIVLQCTRKTEVRQWRTLFAYLPPAQELFEESLQRGSLKTAGGYLIILHTLEELESVSEQSVRVLSRAVQEEDWELCKELARFLAAMDESGTTLRDAMRLANVSTATNGAQEDMLTRLALPTATLARINGSRASSTGKDGVSLEVDAGNRSPRGSTSHVPELV